MMLLEVRLGDRGTWQVRSGDEVVAANETQQFAIDTAKSLARESGGAVVWYDRNGLQQGSASFRPLAWRTSS